MKKLFSAIALVIATSLWLMTQPVQAADLNSGAQVFGANCAACHIGGGNVVNAAKTLKKADLEQYGMASTEAIQTQVTNGKNAMPSFKGRLTAQQIEDVAAYVLAQAEKGW
ncbi:cytochrome c6 PetJ [Geitlerinema sp. PCC 7407]|uniref:cytochrome c6 PetJ n=1 Tax=Geitlerinema sp. PCC 7407 TaxID=1173025 RepID=UPI00029FFEC8|nr:c-type cytochrome [Geitlerinema sp. PCC 7407]AFY67712.1 cytochrome c class I [Geitlerinema sp. PCC 7407]